MSMKVYLIVHELFGVVLGDTGVRLVTPVVNASGGMRGHTYKISRFKGTNWLPDLPMSQGETYTLKGVVRRSAPATAIPCNSEYSPNPRGTFQVVGKPYCDWKLTFPKRIHQMRSLPIPDRPVFTGDPHGDAVEAELTAVSLVQAFEYELDSKQPLQIVGNDGKGLKLDYDPDEATNTVNFHIWAQLEDESGMTAGQADEHSRHATEALVKLFNGLEMQAERSVFTNGLYSQQSSIPDGIRFVELMTLAERFGLAGLRRELNPFCIAKTCGAGGNVYVNGGPL